VARGEFDTALHPHWPTGSSKGGQFAPKRGGSAGSKAKSATSKVTDRPDVGGDHREHVAAIRGSKSHAEALTHASKLKGDNLKAAAREHGIKAGGRRVGDVRADLVGRVHGGGVKHKAAATTPAPAPVNDPAAVAKALGTTRTADEADQLLAGKKVAELRAIAKASGVAVPARATKPQLQDALRRWATRGDAAPSKPAAKKAAPRAKPVVSAADLLSGKEGNRPDLAERLRPVFEGQFGDYSTHISSVEVNPGGITTIMGEVRDLDGNRVGQFIRAIKRGDDGKLVADHNILQLAKRIQGQGLAKAFNGQLIDWYRQSGVDRIELTANVDVGGYSWARNGYDWAKARAAEKVMHRLEKSIQDLEAGKGTDGMTDVAAQIKAGRALLARARTASFGEDRYPTPYEISELGRPQGARPADHWLGKLVLLDSSWSGVRYL
jgi:hypothetical protein